jgi:hypothetical protein
MARTLKKKSVTEINLSKEPVGFKFGGILCETITKPFQTVSDKGEIEEKQLHFVVVENEETKERIAALADAGLRSGLEMASIKQGDYFEAVKLPKRDIGGGRTMNTWDVFAE